MNEQLHVGAASVDFSPQQPELLVADGLHGPREPAAVMKGCELYADAMALRAGGRTVVLATADTGGHGYRRELEIRRAVAERTGIEEKAVLVASRHNHSQGAEPLDAQDPRCTEAARQYWRGVPRAIVDACVRAVADLRPAEIAAGTVTLSEPVGQCRRARFAHGACMPGWNSGPIALPGERLAPPPGPDSTRLDFLAARQVGQTQPFALLTSYASHIHLAASSTFNGELPAGVRNAFRRRIPGLTVVYANSTGGDVDLHCVHPIPPGGWPARMKWYADSLELLGERFAGAVTAKLPQLTYARPPTIRQEYFSTEGQESDRRTRLYLVNAVALGDIAVASIPAELFNELGQRIHAASPFAHLLLMGYNGSGWLGYVGTPLAYEQGGYELARGPAPSPQQEQRLIDAKAPSRLLGRAREDTGLQIVQSVTDVLRRLAG